MRSICINTVVRIAGVLILYTNTGRIRMIKILPFFIEFCHSYSASVGVKRMSALAMHSYWIYKITTVLMNALERQNPHHYMHA